MTEIIAAIAANHGWGITVPIADILGFILAESVWLSGLFTFVHIKHLKDRRIRDIHYATRIVTEENSCDKHQKFDCSICHTGRYYRDSNYTTANPSNNLPSWG
jgi:hypothetical protein